RRPRARGRRRSGRRLGAVRAAPGRSAARGGRGGRPRRRARSRRRGGDRATASGAREKIRGMSSSVSTHVLDTAGGRPAPGVRVDLYDGEALLGTGATDDDGRIASLYEGLEPGTYRLIF